MSFLDPVFPAFLVGALLAHRAARGAGAQNLVLVLASAVFYGWLGPRLLLVLYGSALLDWTAALAIERWPHRARWFVAGSASVHLLVLGACKYAAWGLEMAVDAARRLGVDLDPPALALILPLGLSFYTFQTLGYTIDVARGRVRARKNLVTFLAFATFFPQLVAGPIGRAGKLFPQLEVERRPTWGALRSGLTLAAWGVATKVVVADTLAPYVDDVLALPDPPGVLLWSAALAFGLRVYADVAGYTHVARGTARLFGLELAENFREPFLATSTPDFWRRWHLSISTWMRDYLLVPLLGDQDGNRPLRVAGPLVVTFVLVGLWHGAGGHYALFGLWHAAWSGFYLWLEPRIPARAARVPGARAAAVLVHGFLVLVPGVVIFEAGSARRALQLLTTAPWTGGDDAAVLSVVLLALAAVGGAFLLVEWWARRSFAPWFEAAGTPDERPIVLPVQTTAWSVAALAVLVFHRLGETDFVYFAF